MNEKEMNLMNINGETYLCEKCFGYEYRNEPDCKGYPIFPLQYFRKINEEHVWFIDREGIFWILEQYTVNPNDRCFSRPCERACESYILEYDLSFNTYDKILGLKYALRGKNWRDEERKFRDYKIITLCGSTRFKDAYQEWNANLTLEGNVVISVSMFGHADGLYGGLLTEEKKELLDKVHRWKIDNSDEIFVLDVGGYIGESTRNEIKYAEATNKKVRYLSQEHPEWEKVKINS